MMRRLAALGILAAIGCLRATEGVGVKVDALVRELGHSDVSRRGSACRSLQEFAREDPQGVRDRLPASHEDPDVRASCEDVRVLCDKLLVRMAWQRKHKQVAVLLEEEPDFLETVEVFLLDPKPANAVAMLNGAHAGANAEKHTKVVRAAFLAILSDKDSSEETRAHMLRYLADPPIADRSCVPQVAPFLGPGSGKPVRLHAARFLRNVAAQDPAGIVDLVKPYLDDPFLRPEVVGVIGAAGHPLWTGNLEKWLGDSDPLVVRLAIEAAGKESDKHLPSLKRLFGHPDAVVRGMAVSSYARIVGGLGDPSRVKEAESTLMELYRKENYGSVRCVIVWEIGSFRTGTLVPLLKEMAADPNPTVRGKVASVLKGNDAEEVESPDLAFLAAFLDDPVLGVQYEAADCLRQTVGSNMFPDGLDPMRTPGNDKPSQRRRKLIEKAREWRERERAAGRLGRIGLPPHSDKFPTYDPWPDALGGGSLPVK